MANLRMWILRLTPEGEILLAVGFLLGALAFLEVHLTTPFPSPIQAFLRIATVLYCALAAYALHVVGSTHDWNGR
jgi:uncharacterized protein YhhL (DUF1145 family)